MSIFCKQRLTNDLSFYLSIGTNRSTCCCYARNVRIDQALTAIYYCDIFCNCDIIAIPKVMRYNNCSSTLLASYPGLLTPAFVACNTSAEEGLVKLSHMQRRTWMCGGVAHSFCTAVKWLSEPKKCHQDCLMSSA